MESAALTRGAPSLLEWYAAAAPMKLFRRYRRPIQVVLMAFALAAMAYGFLRRIGVDPLDGVRDEPSDGR